MSNIPTMSWAELWSLYRRSPEPVQQEILRQVDIPYVLSYASKKMKKEILDEAPAEVTAKPVNPLAVQSPTSYEQAAQSCFGPDWQKKLDAEARRRKEMKERRTHRGILSLLIRH